MRSIFDFWRRRLWRRDKEALERLGQTRPATVITGGSEGIGLALARQFAKRRGAVVLVARNKDKLASAKQNLANFKAEIHTIALNITDPNACERLLQYLSGQNLHAHELVNNAAIGLAGDYAKHETCDIEELVNLNVMALSRLTRAVLPDMLVRGTGGIINVASLGGLTPGPYQAIYYASKAYVVSLSRALAYETRGMGLTISCVAPGPVNTDFHKRMDAEGAFYRLLLPAMSAEAIARSTLFWYSLGRKLIIPGVLNTAMAICLSVIPSLFILPIISFLLKPFKPAQD